MQDHETEAYDDKKQDANESKESSEIKYDTSQGTNETKIIKTHPTSGMGVNLQSDNSKMSSDPTNATRIVNKLVDMVKDYSEHGTDDAEMLISNTTRILQEIPKITSTSASQTKSLIGNDFEVMYEIGRGAMGSVYKCYQRSLQRIVAVKILSKKWAENPKFYKMLINEAQMSAQLNHPNIVQIYSVDSDGEKDYMVMEYIKGIPLSNILQKSPKGLKPSIAYYYALQVAEALQVAHSKHLIHRDIKPDNILILEGDQVKVTDFGIACHIDTFVSNGARYRAGTPAFMSPEQAKGDPLDGRSDVFSLGIVLFYMLTGKQPFESSTLKDTLSRVTNNVALQEIDISQTLSEDAVSVLKKALATDPNKRYQSAEMFAAALHKLALKAKIAEDEKARPKYKHPKKYPYYVASAILLVLLYLFIKNYNNIFMNTTKEATNRQIDYARDLIANQLPIMIKAFPYEKEREFKAMGTVLDGKIRAGNTGHVLNYSTDIIQKIRIVNLETYIKIFNGIKKSSVATDEIKKRLDDFIREVTEPETGEIKLKYQNTPEKINYFLMIAEQIMLDIFPSDEEEQ